MGWVGSGWKGERVEGGEGVPPHQAVGMLG